MTTKETAAARLAEIAQLYHAGNETLGVLSMYERAAIKAGVTPGEADAIIARPRAVCAVYGCENAPAWRKVQKLSNGGLAFYYYCAAHKPTATTTDQAETVSIEPVTPAGEVTTPSDRHPTTTGPDYRDADGNPARLVLCPDCGQMEWWTEAECNDHGKCRASNAPCWCEVTQ